MSSILQPFVSHWHELPPERQRQLRTVAMKALQAGDLPLRKIHALLHDQARDDHAPDPVFAPAYSVKAARKVQRSNDVAYPAPDHIRVAMTAPIYKKIFGDKNRLYLPFKIEPQLPAPELIAWLDDKGGTIRDYAKGLAVNQKGQPQRIGRMLQKAVTAGDTVAQKLKHDFDNRLWDEMIMVVTRDPVDMARVSTVRGWTFCHDSDDLSNGGKYLYKQRNDWAFGTIAVYLTDPQDVTLLRPRARITMRPYFVADDPAKEPVFRAAFPIGLDVPLFGDQVNDWLEQSVNCHRYGLFVLPNQLTANGIGQNWVRLNDHQIALAALFRQDHISAQDVAQCLANGADLHLPVEASGNFALHLAVRKRDAKAVKILLEAGADPDGCVKIVDSPLFYAINERLDDVARLLLEAGADPNKGNVCSMTPLMAACANHDLAMVSALLDNRADPNLTYDNLAMRNPLCFAIK